MVLMEVVRDLPSSRCLHFVGNDRGEEVLVDWNLMEILFQGVQQARMEDRIDDRILLSVVSDLSLNHGVLIETVVAPVSKI